MKNSFKLRNLSIAALVGLAGLGATNSAQANETPITPTLGDDASYTLKEISTPTDNSITLYKYDNSGITEAINYEINLKQTEYGTGDTFKESEISALGKTYNYVVNYGTSSDRQVGTAEAVDVSGDFIGIGNSAIYNAEGKLFNDIDGTFVDNYRYYGGAVTNSGNINALKGTFFENRSSGTSSSTVGDTKAGAIYNTGVISVIDAEFIANKASYGEANAGAILNSGEITSLKGSFVGNYTKATGGYRGLASAGGAIYNANYIKDISADFVGNYSENVSSPSYSYSYPSASGGAIFNASNSTIEKITGDFIGNYVSNRATQPSSNAGSNSAYGGAICNRNIIGSITGNFVGNYVEATRNTAWGGAIYNDGVISSINGLFLNNEIRTSGNSWYYSRGGAISNTNEIANISASFIQNTAESGGAIHNSSTIGDITGDFILNKAGSGGAIYNYQEYNSSSEIKDITGNFISNTASYNGGAIYNDSTIGNVAGDFINNYVNSTTDEYDSGAYGGAIYNSENIGTLSGNYIGNYAISEYEAHGGAIYNSGNIGTVNAEIQECLQIQVIDPDTGNLLDTLYVTMDNLSQEDVEKGQYKFEIIDQIEIPLGEITGENGETFETVDEFINYASSQGNNVLMQNPANFSALPISIIDSTFSGNYVSSTDEMMPTSELYVTVRESKYTYRNTTTGESFVVYDLYYDKETIEGLISQGYKINYEEQQEYEYNISDENWANQKRYCEQDVAYGYSSYESRIDEVLDIIPEDAYLTFEPTNNSYGGAIYNTSKEPLVVINTQFDNNSSTGFGGAIANLGEFNNDIGDLTARLVLNNTTFNKNKSRYAGGAIYDYMDVVVRFDKAVVESLGIGLYNAGPDTSDSDLTNYDNTVTHLDIKSSNFTNNESKLGGAIAGEYFVKISDSIEDRPVEASIMPLDMSPELPTVVESDNVPDILVNIENSSFTGNKAVKGGALYFDRVYAQVEGIEDAPVPISLGLVESEVEDVSVQDNSTTYISAPDETKYNLTIKNTSFVNNTATSNGNDSANGGAIYTNMNTRIVADGVNSVFAGNKVINGNSEKLNDIYLVSSKTKAEIVENHYYSDEVSTPQIQEYEYKPTTLNLDTKNNGTISFGGTIDGEVVKTNIKISQYGDLYEKNVEKTDDENFAYNLDITGDGTGRVTFGDSVKKANISVSDTYVQLVKDSNFDNDNLVLYSGTLNMINNQAGVSALNSLTVTGDTNVLVDVDLKNQTMDRFTASEYGSHSGNLNVTGMNLLSDAVNDTTEILFAEQGLKDNVTYGGVELPHKEYQTTLYTPIYKYNASYDNREDAGYFVFSRGDKIPVSGGGSSSTGNPSDAFNPAILGSSTSATVGATATMNQAFNYAFQHSADYMNIPYLERVSMRDRNKYAISVTGDATDMGRFSPLYQPSDEGASVWVKPYATFETVGLKNGPKVHNNTYGTLIGFDTEMQSIKRGWDRVFTGYIGYNGASQRYSGIDSTQNGGLLGGTMTLYKGNFFNATTVSVGASVANNQTMYGNEDFAMLLSGIGNKTGYNFEFKEGKLILQPSMLMSYTFVNTFDYTNAAGVRIDNKPLHALQLAPGVKVIGNLKNGWQPYASVQMVWNLMGESNATANGVKLPEMSIKPYVQYGVGVQKRIKDHFTAYGQAMVQNGGRNGVSLTAGFRWALGHDNCKYKVEDKQLRAKAAKSKCHSELGSESINANKTLTKTLSQGEGATSSKKILKQMTPQQRAAYGGKYYNTTRTAKSGSLRQY